MIDAHRFHRVSLDCSRLLVVVVCDRQIDVNVLIVLIDVWKFGGVIDVHRLVLEYVVLQHVYVCCFLDRC